MFVLWFEDHVRTMLPFKLPDLWSQILPRLRPLPLPLPRPVGFGGANSFCCNEQHCSSTYSEADCRQVVSLGSASSQPWIAAIQRPLDSWEVRFQPAAEGSEDNPLARATHQEPELLDPLSHIFCKPPPFLCPEYNLLPSIQSVDAAHCKSGGPSFPLCYPPCAVTHPQSNLQRPL